MLAAATKTPWRWRETGSGCYGLSRIDPAYSHIDMEAPIASIGGDGSNARAIAIAVDVLPAMLDAIEAAQRFRYDPSADYGPLYAALDAVMERLKAEVSE